MPLPLIEKNNFEIVEEALCQILALEFANQGVLTGDENLDPTVYQERLVDFNSETELSAINVNLGNGNYDNQDIRQAEGLYLFYVDVYAVAKATEVVTEDTVTIEDADQKSAIIRNRLLGMCRTILSNPRYKNLGFQVPYVTRVQVEGIQITMDQTMAQRALSDRMGRLTLSVRIVENEILKVATGFVEMATQVKLYLTDKGYLWGLNAITGGRIVAENSTHETVYPIISEDDKQLITEITD